MIGWLKQLHTMWDCIDDIGHNGKLYMYLALESNYISMSVTQVWTVHII